MKISIGTTFDDKYLFFLPIICWAWKNIGCDVICFMPEPETENEKEKLLLIRKYFDTLNIKENIHYFKCNKNQEATYSQCSRLYAACLELDEECDIIMSDIDMMVFDTHYFLTEKNEGFSIFGADLTPVNQYPICYIKAKAKYWRDAFNLRGKSYQDALDELIGDINCENMRGNYWSKDQEEAYNVISKTNPALINRTNGTSPFATRRLDRDDSYILQNINGNIIDYHMNRPGYEEGCFNVITNVLLYFYSQEKISWIYEYRNEYLNLI